MDVPEIRTAFSLADATAERIRRFRLERIGDIVADETPVLLNGTARAVVHLWPLVSFDPGYRCDLEAFRMSKTPLRPMAATGYAPAVDFDGDYAYTGAQKAGEDHGYSKLFRNGCIETVNSGALRVREEQGKSYRIFPSGVFEKYIFESVHDSLRVLRAASVTPPLLLMLSFLGVRGYSMYLDLRWANYSARPISRDTLIVPELLVESFDLETPKIAKMMRPLFDSIWNACGWQESLNYDEQGEWS